MTSKKNIILVIMLSVLYLLVGFNVPSQIMDSAMTYLYAKNNVLVSTPSVVDYSKNAYTELNLSSKNLLNDVAEYSVKKQVAWTFEDCLTQIDYIENNVEGFANEYNAIAKADRYLLATSVEYSAIIYLYEDKNYGVYIDFNEDNGYVVLTGDSTIYDIQISGDLDFLRKKEKIIFSYIDGFLYLNEKSQLCKFENEINDKSYQAEITEAGSEIIYPGQSKAGDGEIEYEKISEYVDARYSGMKLVATNVSLKNGFPYTNQFNTSFYIRNYYSADGTLVKRTSEGNCSLNAMYTVMMDWNNRGYLSNLPNMNDDRLPGRIMTDKLYSDYGNGRLVFYEEDGSCYNYMVNSETNLAKIPFVYVQIRDFAVHQKGYVNNGYLTSDVPETIEYVANNLNGNNINISNSKVISVGVNQLERQHTCYLSIYNSSSYNNHAVALLGYYKYQYWIDTENYSLSWFKYFYLIADNWSSTPVFFDPNTTASPTFDVCYFED